jgi:hypothetical protein
MDTHRSEEVFVTRRESEDAIEILQIHCDTQRVRNLGVSHRGENVRKPRAEIGKIQVAMGIDDGGWHGTYMV